MATCRATREMRGRAPTRPGAGTGSERSGDASTEGSTKRGPLCARNLPVTTNPTVLGEQGSVCVRSGHGACRRRKGTICKRKCSARRWDSSTARQLFTLTLGLLALPRATQQVDYYPTQIAVVAAPFLSTGSVENLQCQEKMNVTHA